MAFVAESCLEVSSALANHRHPDFDFPIETFFFFALEGEIPPSSDLELSQSRTRFDW